MPAVAHLPATYVDSDAQPATRREIAAALDRQRRHMIVDGARPVVARREVGSIVRAVDRLARIVARDGLHLILRPQSYSGPHSGIRAELWICRGQRIKARAGLVGQSLRLAWREGQPHEIPPVPDLCLRRPKTGRIAWAVRNEWRRADVAWRTIQAAEEAVEAQREAEASEAAEAYVATLEGRAAALQATCRATCLRVAADGRSVVEALHDVGGSMTTRLDAGTESLAADQTCHDAVYHPPTQQETA